MVKQTVQMMLDEQRDLDLPEDMRSLLNYRATLGHKVIPTYQHLDCRTPYSCTCALREFYLQVCHSFQPNCETDVFYHPRFGLIRCIATTAPVTAGQEITIDYG